MSTQNPQSEIQPAPKSQGNEVGLVSSALFGVLTRAGTFSVRDEETTGFVVSCTPEELARVERLPMYRRVAIVETEVLTFRRFEHVLRKHGLVDPCAFDDPEGFDNYRTHGAAHAAYRELLSPNSQVSRAENPASQS